MSGQMQSYSKSASSGSRAARKHDWSSKAGWKRFKEATQRVWTRPESKKPSPRGTQSKRQGKATAKAQPTDSQGETTSGPSVRIKHRFKLFRESPPESQKSSPSSTFSIRRSLSGTMEKWGLRSAEPQDASGSSKRQESTMRRPVMESLIESPSDSNGVHGTAGEDDTANVEASTLATPTIGPEPVSPTFEPASVAPVVGNPREVRRINVVSPSDPISRPIPQASKTSPHDLSMTSESPEALAKSQELVKSWKDHALPTLLEELMTHHGKELDHAVTLQWGDNPPHRIVEVMTEEKLSLETQETLRRVSLDQLPNDLRTLIDFRYKVGKVSRCTSSSFASPPESPQLLSGQFISPQNPFRHLVPLMGDSVGCQPKQKCAGSLGPHIHLGGKHYWLISRHLLPSSCQPDGESAGDLTITHPANIDFDNRSPDPPLTLGRLALHSGELDQTSRPARSMGHRSTETGAETDWALFECTNPCPRDYDNRVRVIPTEREFFEFSDPVKKVFHGNPSKEVVYGTGRTSGWGWGKVGDVPASLLVKGRKTSSWFISHHWPPDTEQAFNKRGLGIPGDSGAPLITHGGNELLGQIWGHNAYKGEPESCRITYFSCVSDIFDEIESRNPAWGRPSLTHPGAQSAT